MKHRLTAPLFAVLVLALAAFTGSAFAGGNGNGSAGGNGNSANAPGHQDQAAPAAAPAPAAPAAAAKQESKPAPASKHESKQSSTSASSPATGGSNAQGVKPSNTTKHDTYAKASSDKTKQYGNGKTAGQIATQAGYGDATLHGPGNSQPHKVLCGGHEVDVHALKHKGDKCGTSTPETHQPATSSSVQSASTCSTTTQTVTEQVLVGVQHRTGNGGFVLIHPNTKSAHYTGKHPDDVPVYETVTKTLSVPTGANCASTQPTVVSTQVSSPPSVVATVAPATASGTAAATATVTPAATATPATATPAAAGAVKGAVVTLKPTKTKPAGGVLGTTTRLGGTVASAKLPFTGLSLWIFVLVAAALIGIGMTVRRSATRRTF